MSETCVRCGEVGEDRRTLFMACFYDMEELELPFERQTYFSPIDGLDSMTKSKDPVAIDVGGGRRINLVSGTVRCSGDLDPREFYTLRVCKDCRAEWMMSIKAWFASAPGVAVRVAAEELAKPGMIGLDGKTFVRALGATVGVKSPPDHGTICVCCDPESQTQATAWTAVHGIDGWYEGPVCALCHHRIGHATVEEMVMRDDRSKKCDKCGSMFQWSLKSCPKCS